MRCAGELQPGEHALLHVWLVAEERDDSVTLQGFGHLQPLDVLRADASIGHVRVWHPRRDGRSQVAASVRATAFSVAMSGLRLNILHFQAPDLDQHIEQGRQSAGLRTASLSVAYVWSAVDE